MNDDQQLALPPTPPTPSGKKNRPRLNVLESIYYQAEGSPTTYLQCKWGAWADSDEQVYQRRLRLTDAWTRLEYGWLSEDGAARLVVIAAPPAERGTLGGQLRYCVEVATLQIGEDGKDRFTRIAIIEPSNNLRLMPAPETSLYLRRPHTSGECLVTVFPK